MLQHSYKYEMVISGHCRTDTESALVLQPSLYETSLLLGKLQKTSYSPRLAMTLGKISYHWVRPVLTGKSHLPVGERQDT